MDHRNLNLAQMTRFFRLSDLFGGFIRDLFRGDFCDLHLGNQFRSRTEEAGTGRTGPVDLTFTHLAVLDPEKKV